MSALYLVFHQPKTFAEQSFLYGSLEGWLVRTVMVSGRLYWFETVGHSSQYIHAMAKNDAAVT